MKKVEHPSPEGALLFIYNSIVEDIKTVREMKEIIYRNYSKAALLAARTNNHDDLEESLRLYAELARWEALEQRSVDWECGVWHVIRMFDLRRNRAKLDGLHGYEPPKKNMVTEVAA